MSSTSASASVSTDSVSVYIPYVFTSFSKEQVTECFESQKIGQVGKVDFVSKTDNKTGRKYNTVYVHFTEWMQKGQRLRETIEKGEVYRFFYNGPKDRQKRFWNLSKNTYVEKPKKEITADSYEPIATEADVNMDIPIPDMSLVSTDYVEILEKTVYEMGLENEELQSTIIELMNQLAFFQNKSACLEHNLGNIEASMRQQLDFERRRLEDEFQLEDGEISEQTEIDDLVDRMGAVELSSDN